MTDQSSSSVDSDNGDDSRSFVRRKFTLTDDVEDLLEDKADEYHAGNHSAFVRHAIRSKASSPSESEIRHELNQIRSLLEELSDKIDRPVQYSEQPRSQTVDNTPLDDSLDLTEEQAAQADETASRLSVAQQLMKIIPKFEEDVIYLSDLHAEVEYSLASVTAGIEELCDRGEVKQLDRGDSIKFSIDESAESKGGDNQ